MADHNREQEERLRELCCIGDEKNVQLLVERGVSINAPNAMNGWTPLHWAAKRGHASIVKYLVQEGVDTTVLTKKGETAGQLSSDAAVREMLGEERYTKFNADGDNLPIVPNYLRNPEFFYARNTAEERRRPEKWEIRRGRTDDLNIGKQDYSVINGRHENDNSIPHSQLEEEIVLKLRIANAEEDDFIEVDLDRSGLTFRNLETVCCEELGIDAKNIKKIRKLPNTIVRNDRDMKRLLPFQELEVVLK